MNNLTNASQSCLEICAKANDFDIVTFVDDTALDLEKDFSKMN